MSKIKADQRQLLPHNLEAEAALVGSILIDPDAVLAARETDLQPSDFYRESNRWIYAAALALADRFEPVDMLTVGSMLENTQNGDGSKLDVMGGPPALTKLVETLPSTVNAGHYARMIRRLARQRQLISVAGEIASAAHEHEGPIDGLFDQVSGLLFEAMDRTEARSHLYGNDETLEAYVLRQQRRKEAHEKNKYGLLKTWLPDLDRILGHLRPAYLHLVGARTSVGKTIYMEQLAEANAVRKHRVAYYHLELTHSLMEDRRMARVSGIPLRRLDEEGYNGPEVGRAMDRIREWHGNIIYVHCPGWTVQRIAADITRLHARGECELALVDYLGLLPLPDGRGNDAGKIGQNIAALKVMAERLEIPVVLGSQVSHAYKQRANKRPRLDDLRGSGEIEERVQQVVMLYRPNERSGADQHGEAELIEAYVDKNTSGATGMAELWHRMGHYRLECKQAIEVLEEDAFDF